MSLRKKTQAKTDFPLKWYNKTVTVSTTLNLPRVGAGVGAEECRGGSLSLQHLPPGLRQLQGQGAAHGQGR